MSLKVLAYPIKVTTSATGANFTAFASLKCSKLVLSNPSAYALDIKWNDVPQFVTIPALTPYYPIYGIADAASVSIRRNDQSNTQIDVFAQALES